MAIGLGVGYFVRFIVVMTVIRIKLGFWFELNQILMHIGIV